MPSPPRATRRAALVGIVGTLALTGCDTDDLRPHDAAPTRTPTAPPGGQTPDETLVDEVALAISRAGVVVRQARAFPDLRADLGALQRTHRAHLAALSASPSAAPAPLPPTSSVTALTGVRATEQALQQQLVTAAGTAESGTLAALLASMSASIAQHLATLPAEPGS